MPQTLTGGIIKKMVGQKNFLPLAKQLIELKEGKEIVPSEEMILEPIAEFGQTDAEFEQSEAKKHLGHEKKENKK